MPFMAKRESWAIKRASTSGSLIRLMGSAALDMAYVACGRLDAYIENGISLWDIAAGWILVETAGGTVELRPRKDLNDKYSIIASNGVIDLKL